MNLRESISAERLRGRKEKGAENLLGRKENNHGDIMPTQM
jgi:hypothetical protein